MDPAKNRIYPIIAQRSVADEDPVEKDVRQGKDRDDADQQERQIQPTVRVFVESL